MPSSCRARWAGFKLVKDGWDLMSRRVVSPILAQLRQGVTPDQIALSLAAGFVLACFPVVGATTLLCLAAGYFFKLNHPTLQVVNYLAYPLQIALLIPFVRLGERLFGVAPMPLSVGLGRELLEAGLRAIAAWCLVAPFLTFLIYKIMRPVLHRWVPPILLK